MKENIEGIVSTSSRIAWDTVLLLVLWSAQARYWVLQFDHPKPLSDRYRGTTTIPGLTRVTELRDGAGRPTLLFALTR